MKPRIAITVGDPSGIGPEVAAQAAADLRVRAACEPVLFAPPESSRFTPGVLSAEAGRAAYDVIVRAEARNVDDLGKLVVAKIQAVEGITRTLTCPVVHL